MKKKTLVHPSFEANWDIINAEIQKRRGKWNLSSIAWMDFDDVAQIIRLHIYQKWGQYDPRKPIQPWISMIITNQIRNLIRNNYTNYARPCLRCDAAVDSDGCKIYGAQCDDCPLYAHWKKHKQPATFIKLPVSMEHCAHEIQEMPDTPSFDASVFAKLHEIMKKILKPIEYQAYHGLYVLNLTEAEVARQLGFISNEKGRSPGYRQLKNIQKAIIAKAKSHIEKEGIH